MESTSDGANDPLDEAGRSSSAGLQVVCGIRRTLCDTKEIADHSGSWILTISPEAWPLRAILLRQHWCWRSSPGEEFFPSWTLRPPLLGRPSFSSLPPLGERLSSSPPHLGERSRPRSRQPIAPENGNSSESPWPSSWPSSPAPRGVPEPAAPLGGRPLGPLAMGPDR